MTAPVRRTAAATDISSDMDIGTGPAPNHEPNQEPGRAPDPGSLPTGGATPAGIVDDVLGALADPTRRQLLDLLAVRGEATATTLAEHLPVTRQAVVKHLAVLDAAGLVAGSRVGREVRYAVRPAALNATARWMTALAADWDRRLATIKRVAEAAEAAAAQAAAKAGPGGERDPLRPGGSGAT